MNNPFCYYSLIICLVMLTSCYNEMEFAPEPVEFSSEMYINGKPVTTDTQSKQMLFPVDSYNCFEALIEYEDGYEIYINGENIENGNFYDFRGIKKDSSFKVDIYKKENAKESYKLKFTLLPVLQFKHHYKKILDEPKGPALFSMVTANNYCINYCGVETRGGTANLRPKKSYGFEFWHDYKFRNNKDTSLLGMYIDDDWILDAVYNDFSRMRNRVSFDLWDRIQRDASKNDLNILYSSIKGQYVELFINNRYNGLYCLNERIEGGVLGITKDVSGSKGFLYKSEGWSDANKLTGLPDTTSIDAEGRCNQWEQKSPKSKDGLIWLPLYKFIDFVVNSSDEAFYYEISDFLVIDQLIDYYILLNVICGVDNVGKNYFLASWSGESPFYIIPWDMDATWGRDHRGDEINFDRLIYFHLFERVIKVNPHDFNQRLKKRYSHLRKEILSEESIRKMFEHYEELLHNSGAVKRNNQKWPDTKSDIHAETEYINEWVKKRLHYLDGYIDIIDCRYNNAPN